MSTLSDFTPLTKALLLRHSLRRSLPCLVLGMAATLPSLVQAQTQEFDFNIAAQPLAGALKALGEQTELQVIYSPDTLKNLNSSAVNGRLSLNAAISQLLKGTGLRYNIEGNTLTLLATADTTGISLDPSYISVAQENPLGVTDGYIATRSTTATKTDTSLMETPQSISVITRDRMNAQGVQTVSEALGYTAGVANNVAGNNPADNTIMIRGFQQITQNSYTDGLKNNPIGYYAPEPFGMERIEVLKGPASVLYGQGSPGGTLNMVSKRPTLDAHHEVGYSTGSDNRQQLSLDISDSLDEQKTLSYRLVALGRDADASVDNIKDDRQYIAPSFTWTPNDDTSLTVLASYQKNTTLFTSNMAYSLMDGSNPHGRVSRHQSLNEPGFDEEVAEQTTLGYELTHRLSDDWTFKQNTRYTHFTGHENELFRNSGVIDFTTIEREYQLRKYANDNIAVDNQLVGKFNTWGANHTLLIGTDYQHNEADSSMLSGDAPPINVYNPQHGVVIDTSSPTGGLRTGQTSRQTGVYVQDQIKIDNWVASLGGRHDWARSMTNDKLADTRKSTSDEAFTGRAGFGYAFDMGLFPYVSYTESFSPISGTDAANSPFKPTEGKQYEVGIKYQPPGGDSYVTLAAYDLRRQNDLTIDPANNGFSVQQGEVRSRGIELEGLFKPTPEWNIIGAYTHNNIEVSKDNPNAAGTSNKGNSPVRVPKHLASLWTDYTLAYGPLAGLGFGAGARYTGSTFGDAANTFKVPNYTVYDAMIKYDLGKANAALKGVSAAVNVKNLTNEYYVAGCFFSGGCLLGAGRTVTADVSYKW